MPRISDMPPPGALTGLELLPAIQGGGADANVGLPVLLYNPAFGGHVLALRVPMVADMSATAEGDPGAGAIRWNQADPHAATELYISDADADAGDLAAQFAALTVGGFIYVQGSADSEARDNLQRWQVTGVVAGSGYTKLEVTLQASGGAFADVDELELSIQQPAPAAGVDRNVVTAAASAGGTLTLDAALGDYFASVLHENVGTLAISNVPPACTLGFWLTQDSTPRSFTWPASFNWGAGNSAPSVNAMTAGQVLFVVITTHDSGGTWDATARIRA